MEGAKLIDWANQQNALNREKTPSEIDAGFDPHWTTLHVGIIEGGTANNITAKDCKFMMTFRCPPGESLDKWRDAYVAKVRVVEAEMQAIVPESWIELIPTFDVPGLKPEKDGEAEGIVRRLTGDNATHKVSYGTEAGQFQERGYSAVICGPGDIAQAHQPNEFVSVAQFEAGQAFMRDLVDMLAR